MATKQDQNKSTSVVGEMTTPKHFDEDDVFSSLPDASDSGGPSSNVEIDAEHKIMSDSRSLKCSSLERIMNESKNLKKIKEAKNRSQGSGRHSIYPDRRGLVGRVQIAGGSCSDVSVPRQTSQQSPQVNIKNSGTNPVKSRNLIESNSPAQNSPLGDSYHPSTENRQSTQSRTSAQNKSSTQSRPSTQSSPLDIAHDHSTGSGAPTERKSFNNSKPLYHQSLPSLTVNSSSKSTSLSSHHRMKNLRNPTKPSTDKVNRKEIIQNETEKGQQEHTSSLKPQNRQTVAKKPGAFSTKKEEDSTQTAESLSSQRKNIPTSQSLLKKCVSKPVLLSESSLEKQKQFPISRPLRSLMNSSRLKDGKPMVISSPDLRPMKSKSGLTADNRNISPTNNILQLTTEKDAAIKDVNQQPVDTSLKRSFYSESTHPTIQSFGAIRLYQKASLSSSDQTKLKAGDSSGSSVPLIFGNSVSVSNAQSTNLNEEIQDNDPVSTISEHLYDKSIHTKQNAKSDIEMPDLQIDLLDYKYVKRELVESKEIVNLVELEKEGNCMVVETKEKNEHESCASAKTSSLCQLAELEFQKEVKCEQEVDVARWKGMSFLDNILEKNELSLESLAHLIPQFEEDGSQVSSPVDAFQYDLTSCVPQKREAKKDLYDEKLERALKESEQLLAELNLLNR